jgi:hypothetical protein
LRRGAGSAEELGKGCEVGSLPAGVIVGGCRGDGCRCHGVGALSADELVDVSGYGYGPGDDRGGGGREGDGYEHKREAEAEPPDPAPGDASHLVAAPGRIVRHWLQVSHGSPDAEWSSLLNCALAEMFDTWTPHMLFAA